MNIYVASSWRNEQLQQSVCTLLREHGHSVYDFRHPSPDDTGFAWSNIDARWQHWTPNDFRDALTHPIARNGFRSDMDALRACDACVLVLPCNRSAHLELGYAAGAGKQTYVLIPPGDTVTPELMYLMCDNVFTRATDLVEALTRTAIAP